MHWEENKTCLLKLEKTQKKNLTDIHQMAKKEKSSNGRAFRTKILGKLKMCTIDSIDTMNTDLMTSEQGAHTAIESNKDSSQKLHKLQFKCRIYL